MTPLFLPTGAKRFCNCLATAFERPNWSAKPILAARCGITVSSRSTSRSAVRVGFLSTQRASGHVNPYSFGWCAVVVNQEEQVVPRWRHVAVGRSGRFDGRRGRAGDRAADGALVLVKAVSDRACAHQHDFGD